MGGRASKQAASAAARRRYPKEQRTNAETVDSFMHKEATPTDGENASGTGVAPTIR
jgi:hypothetical protein